MAGCHFNFKGQDSQNIWASHHRTSDDTNRGAVEQTGLSTLNIYNQKIKHK